jgi:hypothetical protein
MATKKKTAKKTAAKVTKKEETDYKVDDIKIGDRVKNTLTNRTGKVKGKRVKGRGHQYHVGSQWVAASRLEVVK